MSTFNFDRYIKESFPGVAVSGDERIIRCFFCGKKGKLYVNVVKQKFHCFRCGAGTGATLVSFIRDHRGIDETSAWQIIRGGEYAGLPTRDYEQFYAEKVFAPRSRVLPDDYAPLYPLDEGTMLAKRAVAYLRGRGLTDADLMFYQIGYCLSGRYRCRIIVPVTLDKEVVYFVARLFFGFGKRYLNASRGEIAIDPSALLFNWDVAKTAPTLKLAEGVFDAIGLGDDAAALLGKQVHENQLRVLETGKFTAIEIWLDSREKDPLADRDSDTIAEQLSVFNVPITICRVQRGDPGDLRVEKIPVTRYSGASWAGRLARRYSQEVGHGSKAVTTRTHPRT